MEDYSEGENYQSCAPEKYRQGKQKLPQQSQRDKRSGVLTGLWQPEFRLN